MATPDKVSEEYLQSKLESQINEQYELHGWATGISSANPLEILIEFEEADEDFAPTINIAKTKVTGVIK